MTKNDHQKPKVLSDDRSWHVLVPPSLDEALFPKRPMPPEGIESLAEGCVWRDEIAKLVKKVTKERTVEKSAAEFWRRIVRAVGEKKARAIMDGVMRREKPGASPDDALNNLIMWFIREWGLDLTDGKIAKRIHESKPYHVRCKSGASGVATKEIDEGKITHGRDKVIKRETINIKLIALKKKVERVRRQMLDAGDLPEGWRPRSYAPRGS